MDMEWQFNTLEQGKQFAEFFKGLEKPPESYFVWRWGGLSHEQYWKILVRDQCCGKIYPAFSCAELSVLLPSAYSAKDKKGREGIASLTIMKINSPDFKGFQACYASAAVFGMSIFIHKTDKNEAHAKAELLIQLLKDKIIKPDDLKLN